MLRRANVWLNLPGNKLYTERDLEDDVYLFFFFLSNIAEHASPYLIPNRLNAMGQKD